MLKIVLETYCVTFYQKMNVYLLSEDREEHRRPPLPQNAGFNLDLN